MHQPLSFNRTGCLPRAQHSSSLSLTALKIISSVIIQLLILSLTSTAPQHSNYVFAPFPVTFSCTLFSSSSSQCLDMLLPFLSHNELL